MKDITVSESPPAAFDDEASRPGVTASKRASRAWLLVWCVVWVVAMVFIHWASAPGRAYKAEAVSALREATLGYIQDTSADQQQEKLRRARSAFESVAARYPDAEAGLVAQFYAIRISYRLGEWDRAERDAEAFIEQGRDPDDYVVRALEVLYQIHDGRGDKAKAREYFSRMMEGNQR
jgi:tetratricopeptide (TPR) repeat protein